MLSYPVATVELQLAMFTYPGCEAACPSARGSAQRSGLPLSLNLATFRNISCMFSYMAMWLFYSDNYIGLG